MSVLPSPIAQWEEPPSTGAAVALSALTPYLLTDGSVLFYARGDTIPVGAIEASVVDSGSGNDDEIVTPAVTTGRRPTQNGAGDVFLL